MVTRYDDDRRVGERLSEPPKLVEGVEDGWVSRAHGIEEVPGNDDDVRPCSHNVVDGLPERRGNIRFALVDPVRRQTMKLPEPEVDVREVSELHWLLADRLADSGLDGDPSASGPRSCSSPRHTHHDPEAGGSGDPRPPAGRPDKGALDAT